MLTILLIATDVPRARAALSLAVAQTALGRPARIFAHEAAVALFAAAPRDDDLPDALAAHGLPDRLQLLAMARESGVGLIACQTGMAMLGLEMPAMALGVCAGGLVSLLGDAEGGPIVSV